MLPVHKNVLTWGLYFFRKHLVITRSLDFAVMAREYEELVGICPFVVFSKYTLNIITEDKRTFREKSKQPYHIAGAEF